jgi:hypothetical protein
MALSRACRKRCEPARRIIALAAVASAAVMTACSSPGQPSPFTNGPPDTVTGTWLVTLDLRECSGAESNKQCPPRGAAPLQRQIALRLTHNADGTVEGMLIHSSDPSSTLQTAVSGTYRNGVLLLSNKMSGSCGAATTYAWQNTFHPIGGQYLFEYTWGCPPLMYLHQLHQIHAIALQQ